MDNVKKSLPTNWWDMVEKFYPNYYSSDEILEHNILQRYMDNELTAEELVREFGQVIPDRTKLSDDYEKSSEYLFKRSLVEFAKECREMSREEFYNTIEEPMPDSEDVSFFLFGKEACELVMELDFDKAVEVIEADNVSYALCTYNPEIDTPLYLLNQSQGWDDYCILEKSQYDRLSEI